MKIGIIGGGVVGKATARAWMEHADVYVYDKVPEKGTHSIEDTLRDSYVCFICLPTPRMEDSLDADLSYIEDFFQEIDDLARESETALVLRSTVPVGTTDWLAKKYTRHELLHSPEFLTARCAIVDAQLPARNIIGGPMCPARSRLVNIYRERFLGVPLYTCKSSESEMIKLMTNSFFATKIAFFNEMRDLCDHLDLQWSTVLEGVLADGRISHSHTKVPGPDHRRGFGGSCLPGWFSTDVYGSGKTSLLQLKNQYDKVVPLSIKSVDSSCDEVCYKRILSVVEREYTGELIKFDTAGGEFICTPEHLMPVSREGKVVIVRADEIKSTDLLFRVTPDDESNNSEGMSSVS